MMGVMWNGDFIAYIVDYLQCSLSPEFPYILFHILYNIFFLYIIFPYIVFLYIWDNDFLFLYWKGL